MVHVGRRHFEISYDIIRGLIHLRHLRIGVVGKPLVGAPFLVVIVQLDRGVVS